jgi:two-component system response regulator YesN
MWKLMIADDEPRIRNGLRKSLPWEDMGVEVVAEAENGQEALEVAKDVRPDIIFVDINMPFMNGLDLIARLQEVMPQCIIIIISGHDEFAFAQRAVRLNVFDYLLKPVQKSELEAIVTKALHILQKDQVEQKYNQWMNNKLEVSVSMLREEFMRNWLTGKLNSEQIIEECQFFQLHFHGKIGLVLVKPLGKITFNVPNKIWDPLLLEFAVKNIVVELLEQVPSSVVFSVGKGLICAISSMSEVSEWYSFLNELERIIAYYLGVSVLLCHTMTEEGENISKPYNELITELGHASLLTPIVLMTKKYLETYYYKEDLSLSEVADQMNVNANYLSKLLKKELGKSFVDCLTEIRIKKAMMLLNDPTSKIYEIAEKVGYHTQHYFSHIFKKMIGVSPLEYRKRGDMYDGH